MREVSSAVFVRECEVDGRLALELFSALLFRIEMVKSRLSSFKLAVLCYSYSFCK